MSDRYAASGKASLTSRLAVVHSRHRAAGELPLVTKHVADALSPRMLALCYDAGQTGSSSLTRALGIRTQSQTTQTQAVVCVDMYQHAWPQGPLGGDRGLRADSAFGATVITFTLSTLYSITL